MAITNYDKYMPAAGGKGKLPIIKIIVQIQRQQLKIFLTELLFN
jgi:hypothetical protein